MKRTGFRGGPLGIPRGIPHAPTVLFCLAPLRRQLDEQGDFEDTMQHNERPFEIQLFVGDNWRSWSRHASEERAQAAQQQLRKATGKNARILYEPAVLLPTR
jgi:hypothetical protein